jgi:ABC-type transport system substrate-binding protein
VLTYETTWTPTYLDPAVLYDAYGVFMGNVYENLLKFNGSSTSQLVPWLAQGYTVSSDLKTYSFTLRSGITFADGEPLNSTAVYFSLNRVLVMDASTPSGHGTQFAPDFQQLLNTSLSTGLCGCTQVYNANYVKAVLGEDFVQITGPLTFSLHVTKPSSFLPYILTAYNYGMILAPGYVMQHDLALWSQSSNGYTLPYSTLSGNETMQIYQYLVDETATCNSGVTPQGCGTTYLDGSYQGSQAGTGPYTVASFNPSTDDMVFKANPNYWGGAYQFMGGKKIVTTFKTVNMNFVSSTTTRLIDLQNAAKSGQAMIIDLPNDQLYSVANRQDWLNQNRLVSIIPGVSVDGPYPMVGGFGLAFDLNVTSPSGAYYKFQPTADVRFREAIADSVNLTALNSDVNNNLGQVSTSVLPPLTSPPGSYDSSIPPGYGYNPDAVQNLLLSAMEHPITRFTFENGTAAPPGTFDNTFGCTTLSPSTNQCTSPVPATLTLNYAAGDTVNEAIEAQIAGVMNNVSATYNMGLNVVVQPLPIGYMYANTAHEYVYNIAWSVDYPWVTWIIQIILTPGHGLPSGDGWYGTADNALYNQALEADESGNITGLIAVTHEITALENQQLIYLPTFWGLYTAVMTSNIQGFYWNAALVPTLYFAPLY